MSDSGDNHHLRRGRGGAGPTGSTGRGGHTLVETLFTLSIGAMLGALILSSLVFLGKNTIGLGYYSDMSRSSRFALEIFGREARMAEAVTCLEEHCLTLTVPRLDDSSRDITYRFLPARGEWVREEEGQRQVLLRDLTFWRTDLLDRRGLVVARAADASEIRLEGRLSRKVLSLETTDHVLSARFLLRNRSGF